LVYDYDPAAAPLPATLPLFATGLGALGLFGWRMKRKSARRFVRGGLTNLSELDAA
jgi:hypothetical protein